MMKLFGVEINPRNKREERLINIINDTIKMTWSRYKDIPYVAMKEAFEISGQVTALYYMDIITFPEFTVIHGRVERAVDYLYKYYNYTR